MIFFKCKHEIQGGGEREDEKKKKRQLVTNHHRNHHKYHLTWKRLSWRFQHHYGIWYYFTARRLTRH